MLQVIIHITKLKLNKSHAVYELFPFNDHAASARFQQTSNEPTCQRLATGQC